ncbi:MAG: class C sortase [Allobaculum sp.]|uniref:class C sortase n=1 Tax=Allobaculum sp. TaxID=1872463 RepID=UPI00399BEF88
MTLTNKTKKKQSRFGLILALLIMLGGAGLIFYPSISDMVVNYQLSRNIDQYNIGLEGVEENFDEEWRLAEEYNEYLAAKDLQLTCSPKEREYVETLLNPLGSGMIGSIQIPKIGVNIPIYYGTEEQQLQAGAGFWMGSSLPTGGPSTHTVLTAHTGLVRAKLFTDIDKLKNGDQFFIRVLDRTLAYEVDQRLIVDPDEMEPMYIQPGEDLVTLYTCYPYGVNTQRLLVRGHRIPYEEEPENSENLAEKLLKNYWIWILVVLLLLFLLLWWLLHRHRKKKKTKSQKEMDGEKTDDGKTGEIGG